MVGKRNILMWFRADLRVMDNTALHRAATDAAASGGAVIGVFVLCPKQWRRHDWAGIRVDFIRRHLRELSADLRKLRIPLLITQTPWFDGVPGVILETAVRCGCAAVYWNKEYEINEHRRDAAVSAASAKAGVRTLGFTDQVLAEPGEVRTGEGNFFSVFTPFKRALFRTLEDRGGVKLLAKPKKQDPTDIASSPVPDRVDGFTSHVANAADLWPAGESHARQRLAKFVEKTIKRYQAERNAPALDSTSSLSPYLTVGSISARQCVAAAAEMNNGRLDGGDEGAACWIAELAWREFYRHILVGFPRVCMGRAFKPETERLRWSDNDAHFRAWCAGRTGIPLVDAGMRCLAATGWMHNRVRMVVAMFLTKNLFIDWRRGERWFMRHLIDGDLASNNGGWQWSASTGTDAAPYFRVFNPISQSRTCDPDGTYIRTWVPELRSLEGGEKGAIHDPSDLPPLARAGIDYPEPVVDLSASRARAIEAFKAL